MYHINKGAIMALAITATTAFAQFIPLPPVTVKLADQSVQPIEIAEAEVTANVDGMVAETEMTLKFFNPNNRVLEGELSFPLLSEAFVSGYALDVNGRMVDGVIVEKTKARVVFEEVARQGIDPGLAEQTAGNVFKTRLYPLFAKETRTVKVRYIAPVVVTEEAAGQAAYYVLPLRFPNQLKHFRLTLNIAAAQQPPQVVGGSLANLQFQNWQTIYTANTEYKDIELTEDLYVALMGRPEESLAVQKGRKETAFLYHNLLNINKLEGNRQSLGTPVVLWDASLSRDASEHDREIEFLKAALKDAPKITLVVFRNAPEAPVEFTSVDELSKALEAVVYDGGTNLAAALSAVPGGSDAYLFCDGLDTLSAADALKKTPEYRLSAFFTDKDQNAPFLRGLAARTGGICVDLRTIGVADALKLLATPAIVVSKVELDGREVTPETAWRLDGRRLYVAGTLAEGAKALRVTVKCGGHYQVFETSLDQSVELPAGETLRTFLGELKIAKLIADGADGAQLLAAGREYQLVTPNTSLLVLDSLGQYLQYRIRPPESLPELRAEYDAHIAEKDAPTEDDVFTLRLNQPEQVKRLWDGLVAWHNKSFPRTKPAVVQQESLDAVDAVRVNAAPAERVAFREMAPLASASYAASAIGDVGDGAVAYEEAIMAAPSSYGAPEPPETPAAKTTLQAWNSNAPYLAALTQAGDQAYKAYLAQRKDYASSPGFYMDCADALAKLGHKALALRVLTNLAEIELENKALLRILGYQLRFRGELEMAEAIFRKVVAIAEEEPQSYRDLALTLDDEEKFQEAVDAMMTIVNFKFDSRFPEIEAIALTEINRIIARAERKGVKIQNVDEKYRHLVDTDIRIVLNWDADMMDIDLWTTDPHGVKCYYGYRLTPSGGRNSCDFTQGYGPEEFMVRDALKGEYKIEANYYGSHSQKVLGAVTLYTEVYTNYGRPNEKREVLTCRLNQNKEVVLIGTIDHDGTVRPRRTAPFDYQVKKGDTLESIAREQLGDAALAPEILKSNPQITDPDHLRVGTILHLVPKGTPQNAEAR